MESVICEADIIKIITLDRRKKVKASAIVGVTKIDPIRKNRILNISGSWLWALHEALTNDDYINTSHMREVNFWGLAIPKGYHGTVYAQGA